MEMTKNEIKALLDGVQENAVKFSYRNEDWCLKLKLSKDRKMVNFVLGYEFMLMNISSKKETSRTPTDDRKTSRILKNVRFNICLKTSNPTKILQTSFINRHCDVSCKIWDNPNSTVESSLINAEMLQTWWAVPAPNDKLNLTISFCSDRSIEKHQESSLHHERTGTFISNIYRNIHPFFLHKNCKLILGPRQILKEKNPTDEFDDSIIVSMQTQLNKKYTQFVEMTASEENQVIVIPNTQSTLNSETPSETNSETPSLEVGKVIVLQEYETAAPRTGKKS